MTRAVRLTLLFAVIGCIGAIPAVAAESHTAAIAGFAYTPTDVRIGVGDTVVWTNADPTVHTVTARRNEFSSGSMRQGQTFSATFNVPGVYSYFCEPHEFMRGTVSVAGATTPAPQPGASTTTTTTTSVAGTGGAAARRSTVTTTASSTALSTASSTPTTIAFASSAAPTGTSNGAPAAVMAVTAGPVAGGARHTPPAAAAAILLALAVAGLVLLVRSGVDRVDALRYVAAAATALTGSIHLQLQAAVGYPEPIGTLMVIESGAAVLLALWLIARPASRQSLWGAAALHVIALGALVVTRTSLGLFGFHERGWDPSPQLPLAVTAGFLATVLLLNAGYQYRSAWTTSVTDRERA